MEIKKVNILKNNSNITVADLEICDIFMKANNPTKKQQDGTEITLPAKAKDYKKNM